MVDCHEPTTEVDRFAPLSPSELSEAPAGVKPDPDGECIMPVPADAPTPTFRHPRHGDPSKVWTYHDEVGAVAFHVCRFDEPDGSKEFSPRSWWRKADGHGEWRWKSPTGKLPLYRLDELTAKPSSSVVICEGEKAAAASAAIFPKSVVTCWAGGSNAVAKTDFGSLAGRPVLLWPDNDAPGRKAMVTVAGILCDLGCEVQTVDAAKAAGMVPDVPTATREAVETWDAADAVSEWSDLPALRKAVFALATRIEPPPKYLSFGAFTMTSDGLTAKVTKGRGPNAEMIVEKVCAAFEVIGRVRDPDGNGWAKLIRWRDEDGRIHTFTVADGILHGDPRTFVADLASKGLMIHRGAGALLADYLNRAVVDQRVTTVARTGWHDVAGSSVFVLPDESLGAPAGETVILSGANTAPFEVKGTLAEWKAGVGSLVRGHHRHTFVVAAALAGPLLALVKQDGGGFNLYGGSSTGKSTAIEAAASVWGRGASSGYVRSWRSTANALEASAALHTDTALVLDELGVVDAKEAGAAAYQLAAGSGKGRSARDGSLRAPVTWRTLILSTGEMRLADKLTEGKQRAMAGQAVRLVDIPADAGKGFGSFDGGGATGNAKDHAEAIKRAARTRYGTAGPEFVRRVIAEGLDEVAGLATAQMDAFRSQMVPAGADGQIQRAADRFGLVAAAGEIATGLGVVPWSPGETKAAAEACFVAWLDARGGSEAHEVREAIERVRGFIEAHGDSRFEPLPKESLLRPVLNRVGYRRGEGAGREWLVFPEAWKTEVVAGLDPKAVAGWLVDRGMLRKSTDGNQVVVKIEGQSTRFYSVTAAILSGTTTGAALVSAAA